MTQTEVKKALYKEKPTADLIKIQSGSAFYEAKIEGGLVTFRVPVKEMGETPFTSQMDAKLLIRWLTW